MSVLDLDVEDWPHKSLERIDRFWWFQKPDAMHFLTRAKAQSTLTLVGEA